MSGQDAPLAGDFLYGLALLAPQKTGTKGGSEKGSKIFAARATGLYHCEDGKTWQIATQSLGFDQAYSATAVAVTPAQFSSAEVILGLAGGLLVSRDAGSTWQAGSLPNPPPVISCFAASPDYARDGVLLAGSLEDGVLRSADRGSRWVQWNFGLLDLAVMCLGISPAFARDETVFAGTESGLFRSTNGGRAWKELELPVGDGGYEPVMCLALTADFDGEEDGKGSVFAGTESAGLFRSDDRGKSWKRIAEAVIPGGVQAVLVDPAYEHNNRMLVVSDGSVLVTADVSATHGGATDGGATNGGWDEVWGDLTASDPAAAVLAPEGLEPGSKVWLGLVSGEVRELTLP